jgi:hypothetical protein
MLGTIVMGWRPRHMRAPSPPGEHMWIIELNVAGYRFTREVANWRRPLRFHRREMPIPTPQPSRVPAA